MSQRDPIPSWTNPSLLSRVRNPTDVAAWQEFERRYRDLLVRFCRSGVHAAPLQQADAEDIAQIVLTSIIRGMPRFHYDRSRGRFRDYLFRCARNAIARQRARPNQAAAPLVPLDDERDAPAPQGSVTPAESALAAAWEKEWIAHHYRLAMDELRTTIDPKSLAVFDACMAGKSIVELQQMFDMTDHALYKARARVKQHLEATIARQIEEEDALGA